MVNPDPLADYDPLDDKYRWCIYCGCDCWPDDADHASDCPQTTGIYPVTPEDIGTQCCDCGAEFQEGDTYALQPSDVDNFYCVVCAGCAVLTITKRDDGSHY